MPRCTFKMCVCVCLSMCVHNSRALLGSRTAEQIQRCTFKMRLSVCKATGLCFQINLNKYQSSSTTRLSAHPHMRTQSRIKVGGAELENKNGCQLLKVHGIACHTDDGRPRRQTGTRHRPHGRVKRVEVTDKRVPREHDGEPLHAKVFPRCGTLGQAKLVPVQQEDSGLAEQCWSLARQVWEAQHERRSEGQCKPYRMEKRP